MTEIEELLRVAADEAPSGLGMLAAARRAAGREQRRRTALAATFAAAVVTAVVAFAVWPVEHRDATNGADTVPASVSEPSATESLTEAGVTADWPVEEAQRSAMKPMDAASAQPPGCDSGFARGVAPSSVADEVGLVSSNPSYRIVGRPLARMMSMKCARPAIPLIFRGVEDGVVRRAISVTGPLRAQERVMVSWPQDALLHPVVRGVVADLVVHPDGNLGLAWVDSDGNGWLVQTSGLTRAEIEVVAEALVLGPTVAVDRNRLPVGLEQMPSRPAGNTAEAPVWYANYQAETLEFQLQVRAEAGQGLWGGWAGGSRMVTVRGHEAAFRPPGNGPPAYLKWEERPGVWASVSATSATQADLERFASSLEFAGPNDIRLAAR